MVGVIEDANCVCEGGKVGMNVNIASCTDFGMPYEICDHMQANSTFSQV